MTDAGAGNPRVACDAMCGGLARWLRALGVDARYEPDIDDARLVRVAQAEGRIVISSDARLFERRAFATGALRGLRLPVGLRLGGQLERVVASLGLVVGFPRCPGCNGELERVSRAEVADVVPARSLIWAREFFRCAGCAKVYWDGTHWRRIERVRGALAQLATGRPAGSSSVEGATRED